MRSTDVAIVGAGPSGALAAAMLASSGYQVEVFERGHFPRFSIGESLLPQSMAFLEQAGLLDCVNAAGFQFKDGAVFRRGDEEQSLDFREKLGEGWDTTFEVKRDLFDRVLIEGAIAKGAKVSFGTEVIEFEPGQERVRVRTRSENGTECDYQARFALDASGFGRSFARLLKLDHPSDFPVRKAVFCHVRDRIDDPTFDRNKILISIHDSNPSVWYWLIPLAGGLSSIGAVGPEQDVANAGSSAQEQLFGLIRHAGRMKALLANSEQIRPADTITGYARKVDSLYGPGFALLGNAAEFLDPVFSSGLTIAFKSAALAVGLLQRQFKGETIDWEAEFARPLMVGIDAFRSYVEAWYDTSLQSVIFAQPRRPTKVKRQIISVLAGYAWDMDNPFVRDPKRYLAAVKALSTSGGA